MGGFRLRRILLVLLSLLLVFSPTNAFASSQVTSDEKMELESFEITPTQVTVGEEVTFKAKVKDNYYGTRNVAVRFDSGYNYIYLSYDEDEDLWIGTFTPTKLTAPGEKTVTVWLRDKIGNDEYFFVDETFTVVNPQYDGVPPVIENIEVDKESVEVGDTITISATITDELSGISDVYAEIASSESIYYYLGELVYNKENDKWMLTYTVEDEILHGEYEIHIIAADNYENTETAVASQLVTIINPDNQVQPPFISEVYVTPEVVNAGEEVFISVVLDKDPEEIAYIVAHFDDPSGDYESVDLTYNENENRWEAKYTLDANAREGDWLISIHSEDIDGNYSTEEKYITVHNPDGDWTPPVIESIVLSSYTIDAGETLTIKAKVTDDKSGVKFVEASLYSVINDKDYKIELSYNQTEELWIGSIVIDPYVKSDQWEVIVRIEDHEGNYSWGYTEDVMINNTNPDLERPAIENIDLRKSKQGELTVQVKASDDYAGVRDVYVVVQGPYGTGYPIDMEYDAESGIWHGTREIYYYPGFHLDPIVIPGEWIAEVQVIDDANNIEYEEKVFELTSDLYEAVRIVDTVASNMVGPYNGEEILADLAERLFNEAKEMNDLEAIQAYQLLSTAKKVPQSIISAAQSELKALLEKDELEIEVDATGKVVLPADIIDELDDSAVMNFHYGSIDLSIPLDALTSILADDKDLELMFDDRSDEFSEAVSQVIDFNLLVDGEPYSDYFDMPLTILFQVDPTKINDWENLVLRYIDEEGNIEDYKDQIIHKDDESGIVEVEVKHFSMYGVFESTSEGENEPEDLDDQARDEETDPSENDRDDNGDDLSRDDGSGEGDTPESDETSTSDGKGADTEEEQENDGDKVQKESDESAVATEFQDSGSGEELPRTATGIFNALAIGGLLLMIGALILLARRKRA